MNIAISSEMKTYVARILVAGTGIVGLAAPAWAHAHLKTSMPMTGSTVQASPNRISMDFTEGLELAFSGVSITDNRGAPVSLSDPVLGAPDDTELSAAFIKPLMPGRYSVAWHALSKDGHKTEGKYDFSVAP
ncbi:copper homeostasis periplasmic binding protein CopC [Rhizobium sp. SG741]|uniref:copper homeostasis periplasmic binding protein CopC n=1 Tax=Rhizobium sp. SG741 TaxID=2587114 RepID=UPI00144598B8|nr:copper homeostasis periplasmic binding protein CopC [Rhizobium sp. SG741]NKJ08223.1 hypothetical protein [Rhizobium sp. SG741]